MWVAPPPSVAAPLPAAARWRSRRRGPEWRLTGRGRHPAVRMAALRTFTGTVTTFDEPRGLGEVTGEDGTAYPFHCTQIADGSRTIAEGTAVRFEVVPGRMGRWEAAGITPR